MNWSTILTVAQTIGPVLNRAGVPKLLEDYAEGTDEQWDDIVASVLATAIRRSAGDSD